VQAGHLILDQSRLIFFSISDSQHIYIVDLRTGAFSVDGSPPFRMHSEDEIEGPFRLIFFRRHKHSINAEYQELSHQIVYRLGWQANDRDGKNVQRVMEID